MIVQTNRNVLPEAVSNVWWGGQHFNRQTDRQSDLNEVRRTGKAIQWWQTVKQTFPWSKSNEVIRTNRQVQEDERTNRQTDKARQWGQTNRNVLPEAVSDVRRPTGNGSVPMRLSKWNILKINRKNQSENGIWRGRGDRNRNQPIRVQHGDKKEKSAN